MEIKNQKELQKFLQTKTDIFSQKKKTPIINHKLTKQLAKTLKKTQIEPLFHAKNVFLYDKLTHSFLIFEHLFLLPQGIVTFNYVDAPKGCEIENELWWKSKQDSMLYPCPTHQLSVTKERLSAHFLNELNEIVPVTCYNVTFKTFMEDESLIELKDIPSTLAKLLENPPLIQTPKLSMLRTHILEWHKESREKYAPIYSPNFYHTNSYGSVDMTTHEFKQSLLYLINTFLYEFAPESIVFCDLQLPVQGIAPIDFLILSHKGILILNTLEGYAKYDGELEGDKWIKTTNIEGQHQIEVKIDNPTKISIAQLQLLSKLFKSPDLPETFRIVKQNPIQCQPRHKAIIDDKHLEHHLDRYFTNTEDFFDEFDIKRVVSLMNQLIEKQSKRSAV